MGGWALPVLFDVDVPFPLEILLLVVVREEGVDVVGAPPRDSPRRILDRRGVALYFGLGRVGADHVDHLVHRHAHAARLLHVLQAGDDLSLENVIQSSELSSCQLNSSATPISTMLPPGP